jgi:hypothetical protein
MKSLKVLMLCCLSSGALHAQATQNPTSEQAAPPACDKPENRQFDFWVGHWSAINTKDGKPAGESRIEKLYQGCTIRENWSEPGYSGGSLNTFVAADGKWHQTWTDSAGTWREYVGSIVDGKMVLVWTHPAPRDTSKIIRERVTLSANADGTVRQYSDGSRDGGSTWTELYDYTYRPIAP